MTSREIIAVLEQAAQAVLNDPRRRGNIVHLEGPGDVVMTGDLHDNHRNYDKLVRYCKLEENQHRHFILHELIHGNTFRIPGQCHSYELIYKAAQLILKHPDQVRYMLGNHAMAQINRDEIIKNGQPAVRALNAGILDTFGSNAQHVSQALENFLLALPIAIRTDNRVWMSHSLPSKRHLKTFDMGIFEKTIKANDISDDESLHALIWDRVHTQESISQLKELLDVDLFLVGHKPQPQGYGHPLPELIILASDHNHGCFLPFELERTYTGDELEARITPIAALV